MAKGKTANPADAYRKAQRKKELKKNKAERAKARDFALVKQDTRDLEDDIAKLESTTELSASDKARLKELKAELEKVNKKKEEYVQEHPEHRRLVYKSRKPPNAHEDKKDETSAPKKRNLFKKNGLPRHPERSIYYDPVMNPYGVPPPGQPYFERALLPHEIDSEAEGSDDDIVMPEGPPPEESEDSDDDIPMPEGPPPPKPGTQSGSSSDVSIPPPGFVPTPPMVPPLPLGVAAGFPPPPPAGMPLMALPPGIPIPPPPPSRGIAPFPSLSMPPPLPLGLPPPPGFAMPPPQFSSLLPSQHHPTMPPPPPGFVPRNGSVPATVQDPLSPIPHQTYQAHRAARNAGVASKATSGGVRLSIATTSQPPPASAVISAEPELRDLKKESTSFVPAALKRKKPGGTSSKVNAAPIVGPSDSLDDEVEVHAARPDLLSTLHDKFGAPLLKQQKVEARGKEAQAKPKDHYDMFLEEMSDILGTGKAS